MCIINVQNYSTSQANYRTCHCSKESEKTAECRGRVHPVTVSQRVLMTAKEWKLSTGWNMSCNRFNEAVLRVCSVMVLLQEISWLSQDDILLHVQLQCNEPSILIHYFCEKNIMRNWRSKVTAGVTETKINLADCELSVKRAIHWFGNMFHFSALVV